MSKKKIFYKDCKKFSFFFFTFLSNCLFKSTKIILMIKIIQIFLQKLFLCFFSLVVLLSIFPLTSFSNAIDITIPTFKKGEILFANNCSVCHIGGNNIIIPEKNLKQETLDANGMNTISAISYQILNGKNGMPAFGGRLTEEEIEAIATYVLEKSLQNFQ